MSLKLFKQIFFVQNEIKKVLDLPLEERKVEIRKLAKDLGCPLDSTYNTNAKHFTNEVVRRIREAARSYRESYYWLITVILALTSLTSAIAAWCAVLKK